MTFRFQYQAPATRILFGPGTAAQLGKQAARLGMRRAFLVTDPVLAESAACQAARAALGAAGVADTLFAEVVPDPTDRSVEHAAECYRAASADGLVALGGGSAMDTAKALGVLIAGNATQIAPYYFGGSATHTAIPPLICLPTTAGTGAEVTYIAIVTEGVGGRKMLVRDAALTPSLALVDPQLCATMPPALTAATGMDALSHALEALTSTLADPLSDSMALDAIPHIFAALPRAVADGTDMNARTEMSYAALAAGLAFLNARLHLGHAVGHSLGAAYHLPHGLACIICMPAILAFLAEPCRRELGQIARALGVDAGDLPAALDDLMRRCGIPRLGAALGADSTVIPHLIDLVQGEQRLIGLSHRQPTVAEWHTIFAQSF